jgi:hypothetical protein
MWNWRRYAYLLFGLLAIVPIQQVRAERLTFVTGFNEYTTLPRLSTAVNDATAAAETLRRSVLRSLRLTSPAANNLRKSGESS